MRVMSDQNAACIEYMLIFLIIISVWRSNFVVVSLGVIPPTSMLKRDSPLDSEKLTNNLQ